jgi:hypothetical protein
VASSYPDEGLPSSEGGDSSAELPSRAFRSDGTERPAHTETHSVARAELRDRETYYAELRFAVYGQSRSVPAPRAALDDDVPDGSARGPRRTGGEGWNDVRPRFGDTWT